ncbi:MAG TPA: Imm49 family immunity protein [Polyangiales bacterium]|nr:Imm49 family immunity protein [Polyangiales bacterium]
MFEHGVEIIAADLAFWSLALKNPSYPISQLGALSLELSDKFRALAIMQLLTEGSTDLFLHNLIRSGRTRELYLQRLAADGVSGQHHQASGRYRPLISLIAAGDIERARHISELSPSEFQLSHEYEDDYCYAQLLSHLLLDNAAEDARSSALLSQFEGWLEDASNVRLDLCQALLQRDQAAFDDAFEGLLLDHEESIEVEHARGQHEDDAVRAERLVMIEGLAMLRLAQRQGLQTADDYRYCPSLARAPMKVPFPGE